MTEIQRQIYETFVEFDRVCKKLDLKYVLSYGTLLGAVRHEGFIPWDDDIDVVMDRDTYEEFLQGAPEHFVDAFFLQTNTTDPEYFFPFAKIRNDKFEMREKASAHLDINHGVWIDVFPYDELPDDENLELEQFEKIKKYNDLLNFFLYMYVTGHERPIIQQIKKFVIFLNHKTYKYNFMIKHWYKKREEWIKKYNGTGSSMLALQAFRYRNKEVHKRHFIEADNFNKIIELKFEDAFYPAFQEYDCILRRMYGDYMTLPPITEQKSVHTFAE